MPIQWKSRQMMKMEKSPSYRKVLGSCSYRKEQHRLKRKLRECLDELDNLDSSVELYDQGILDAYEDDEAVIVAEPCEKLWTKHKDTLDLSVIKVDIPLPIPEDKLTGLICKKLPNGCYYTSNLLVFQVLDYVEANKPPKDANTFPMLFYVYFYI